MTQYVLNKYLDLDGAEIREREAIWFSTGSADAFSIIRLGPGGLIDPSLLPTTGNFSVEVVTTVEALAVGDFVNFHTVSNQPRVRKARANDLGRVAHGFVMAAFAANSSAVVFLDGVNSVPLLGSSPYPNRRVFLHPTTAGLCTVTPPSTAGQYIQSVGYITQVTATHCFIKWSPLPIIRL